MPHEATNHGDHSRGGRLAESLRFYRDGLGLPTDGIVGQEFEYGAVVFIELELGVRLALWPRTSIAHDTGLSPGRPSSTEFTLGHNVSTRAEVDAVMDQARKASRLCRRARGEVTTSTTAGTHRRGDGALQADPRGTSAALQR